MCCSVLLKGVLLVRSGKCPLMIATDVAARGLDVPDVVCVINYRCVCIM